MAEYPCPFCCKRYPSDHQDVGWVFLCLCGYLIVLREEGGVLRLEAVPDESDE